MLARAALLALTIAVLAAAAALAQTAPAALIVGPTAPVDVNGKFGVRVNFTEAAPAGKVAVVDAFKGPTKIGTVKVNVSQGKSVRARVKLTDSGKARVRRHGKLKVTVRLSLEKVVLETKTTTLKRYGYRIDR
jgi:DnaJ-class molecular chaperone